MIPKVLCCSICFLVLLSGTSFLGAETSSPLSSPSFCCETNGMYWVGVEYTFFISHVDPNENQWYLMVDWGDGTQTSWLGPYASGEAIPYTHYWIATGHYAVKVKIKDIYGHESEWSSPIPLTIIPPPRCFKQMELKGTLKTRLWKGLFFSILNIDCAIITQSMVGDVCLDPFTCHNYRFLAIALQVHSYERKNPSINASTPLAFLLGH
jgi:hypothetical protein